MVDQTLTCPYCSSLAVYTDSKIVYGKSYGMIYLCQPCKAWVGVHKGTNKPLGRLADEQLRKWKCAAHTSFDTLWRDKRGKNRRDKAYAWLATEMGISPAEAHIGMFDIEQCRKVVELCKPYLV